MQRTLLQNQVYEALLGKVSKAKTPKTKRSHVVRCPCCQVLTERGIIMWLSYNKFRCIHWFVIQKALDKLQEKGVVFCKVKPNNPMHCDRLYGLTNAN